MKRRKFRGFRMSSGLSNGKVPRCSPLNRHTEDSSRRPRVHSSRNRAKIVPSLRFNDSSRSVNDIHRRNFGLVLASGKLLTRVDGHFRYVLDDQFLVRSGPLLVSTLLDCSGNWVQFLITSNYVRILWKVFCCIEIKFELNRCPNSSKERNLCLTSRGDKGDQRYACQTREKKESKRRIRNVARWYDFLWETGFLKPFVIASIFTFRLSFRPAFFSFASPRESKGMCPLHFLRGYSVFSRDR